MKINVLGKKEQDKGEDKTRKTPVSLIKHLAIKRIWPFHRWAGRKADATVDGHSEDDNLAWLANKKHNETECALFQLPYDVFFLVCGRLDDNTKRVLRQTSSPFREMLVPDTDTVTSLYVQHGTIFHGRLLSPVYKLPAMVEDHRAVLRLTSHRDYSGYCADCRKFRQRGSFDVALNQFVYKGVRSHNAGSRSIGVDRIQRQLWCSGCNMFHTPLLFSAAQSAVPATTRMCIGWEGHMTVGINWLCKVSWSDLSFQRVGIQDRLSTNGPINRLAPSPPPSPLLLPEPWEMVSRTYGNPNIYLSKSPVTDMSARGVTGGSSWSWFWISKTRSTSWRAHLFDAGEPHITRRLLEERLTQALTQTETTKARKTTPTMTTPTTTKKMPPLRRRKFDGVLANAAFCTHVAAGDTHALLMQAFAPDQCACFDDELPPVTLELVSKTHASAHHDHSHWARNDDDNEALCCRCRTAAKPSPSQDDGQHRTRDVLPQELEQSASRSTEVYAAHQYRCRQCPAVYTWIRESSGCVYLSCTLTIERVPFMQPTSREWLRSLDPASWNPQDRPALHRVTWCKTAGCKTTSNWYKLVERPDDDRVWLRYQ